MAHFTMLTPTTGWVKATVCHHSAQSSLGFMAVRHAIGRSLGCIAIRFVPIKDEPNTWLVSVPEFITPILVELGSATSFAPCGCKVTLALE